MMKSILVASVSVFVQAAPYVDVSRLVLSQADGEYTGTVNLEPYHWQISDQCSWTLRGYNGGSQPAIYVNAGDTVNINFHNKMAPETDGAYATPHNTPRLFNTSNLHTHGLQISPVAPSDDVYIEVDGGGSYAYKFIISSDHAPGTHWYHGHHHGSTTNQVMSGVMGFFIIRDDPAQTPAWVNAMPEIPMAIRVLSKATMAKFQYSPGGDRLGPQIVDGCADDLAIVNNQHLPEIGIKQGEWTRLRVLMAGPMKHLALLVPAGCEMWIMSLDGIYMDKPVHMPTTVDDPKSRDRPIFFASGNRRDIAVMCSAPGTYKLESSTKYEAGATDPRVTAGCNNPDGIFGDDGDTFGGLVATLVVTGPAVNSVGPSSGEWFTGSYLRPSYLTDLQNKKVDGGFGVNVFTTNTGNQINGRSFKPPPEGIAEWQVPLGEVFEMSIMAMRSGGHPYHQHVSPFQMQPTFFNYSHTYGFNLEGQWSDTLLSHEGCFLPVRFVPKFAGKLTVHCHLLMHEDSGMMLYGDIVEPKPNCCVPSSSCTDANTAQCVCGFDPYCCSNTGSWDDQCISEAQTYCKMVCPS